MPMQIGFGIGLPFARSAAAPATFNPATLPWVAGRKRNWWHNNGSAGSLSIGANGTGGVPAINDPVGSIILTGTDAYILSYGNTQGTLKADGVQIPLSAYFIKSLSGTGNIRDTGMTVAACVRLPDGQDTFGTNTFGGTDASPLRDTASLGGTSTAELFKGALDTELSYDVTADNLNEFHRLIFSAVPLSGNSMSCKMFWDGVLVQSGTLNSTRAWDRDLPYMLSRPFIWQSRLFAQQGFSDDADLLNIDNFLENGA